MGSRSLSAACLAALLALACERERPAAPADGSRGAKELVFYNWAEDMPQSVLDAFTAKHGIEIKYVSFESQEEAIEKLRAGTVAADVAVLENDFVEALAKQGLLAEIDFGRVPNFKNISPNFRDLATDPGNRHSVPYHYGTTGLLVRTDLVGNSVTRWAELWDPRFAGKLAMREQPREVLAFTLLSLGHSLNSEDPQELEAALKRLQKLRKSLVFVEVEAEKAVPRLLSGEVVVLQGWAEDYSVAVEKNRSVRYVLPEEGTALWGDSYVIPAKSPRKATAELFLDFLLQPEISAQIVNEKRYANANEAAFPLVKPEIRDDPVIYPPLEQLRNAHFYRTLSAEGERLYADVWRRFLASGD